MEENENVENFYWSVIETLSGALREQVEIGKYNAEKVQKTIDELDLEYDRRIVFDEPTEEIVELRGTLEDFVEEED